MLEALSLQVMPQEAGLRADLFLTRRIPTTDRALVRMAFEENAVRINGRPAAKGAKVKPGDFVEVVRLLQKTDRRVLPDPGTMVTVLYVDKAVIVFEKPPGMPVHPLRIGERGTLANAMVTRFPETTAIGPDPMFPALLHRIDADTSGIVLAARNSEAYDYLRNQFRTHQIIKEYLAIVHGVPSSSGRLIHYLAHDPKRPGYMLAATTRPLGGAMRWMKAVTVFQVERSGGNRSLLRITIRTGVTHQIRCQLAAIGHPIIGDLTYSQRGAADRLRFHLTGHCLHACAISFLHPTQKRRVRFESKPPDDWNVAIPPTDQHTSGA